MCSDEFSLKHALPWPLPSSISINFFTEMANHRCPFEWTLGLHPERGQLKRQRGSELTDLFTELQERPSPLRQRCIPPFFRFPLFPKNCQTPSKILTISHFPKKNLPFIRQNFWRPFSINSIFAVSIHFPPISGKLLFPLLFHISLWFCKIYVFYILSCFSFHPSFTMMHLCITQCT